MIYTKEPILVLWDIVKDLGITAYKEAMIEDENNTPDSYILLRANASNNPRIHGDGSTKVRKINCDIILISKGANTNTTDIHNVNKALIENQLKILDLNYTVIDNGFSNGLTETTYSVDILKV